MNSNGLIVSFGEMLIDFVPTVSGVSLADAPGFLIINPTHNRMKKVKTLISVHTFYNGSDIHLYA